MIKPAPSAARRFRNRHRYGGRAPQRSSRSGGTANRELGGASRDTHRSAVHIHRIASHSGTDIARCIVGGATSSPVRIIYGHNDAIQSTSSVGYEVERKIRYRR